MISRFAGPAFVGLAAILWATDSLFRVPAVNALSPILIVLVDHLICVLALLPWVLLKQRQALTALTYRQWFAAVFIGAGGSAVATILFTASFRYINPSVTILLQKLQPVIVVAIAAIFLNEKPKPGFLLWAAVALVAGLVLSFPDLDFSFLRGGLDLHSLGVMYALSAASVWAVSTVVGKVLVSKTTTSVATFWRYFFGLCTTAVLMATAGGSVPWEAFGSRPIVTALLYISLIPGLLAMLFYYRGLSKTPASVATFMELLFPVSAIVLNTVFLNAPLQPVQVGAAAVLLFAIFRITA